MTTMADVLGLFIGCLTAIIIIGGIIVGINYGNNHTDAKICMNNGGSWIMVQEETDDVLAQFECRM